MLVQFVEKLQLWEGPILEQLMKACSLLERPHAEAGENCEEEGAAERISYEMRTAPVPPCDS